MTPLELRSYFRCIAICADESYALPTLRWLQGEFWTSFQADRWAKGLKVWARKNDCDSFARAFAQHAQDCHAMSHGSDAEGLAVGEVFYTKRTGEGHAIVCAFTEQGRTFIEPQTGLTLELTEGEISCIFFARF